jgi:hypothetical protein
MRSRSSRRLRLALLHYILFLCSFNLRITHCIIMPQQQQQPTTVSALSGKEGVCRIEVARVTWHHVQPWQRLPQTKATGTGFVIEGERLLTNAHVVQSAVDIRVRPHGSTRRFPGKWLFVALYCVYMCVFSLYSLFRFFLGNKLRVLSLCCLLLLSLSLALSC